MCVDCRGSVCRQIQLHFSFGFEVTVGVKRRICGIHGKLSAAGHREPAGSGVEAHCSDERQSARDVIPGAPVRFTEGYIACHVNVQVCQRFYINRSHIKCECRKVTTRVISVKRGKRRVRCTNQFFKCRIELVAVGQCQRVGCRVEAPTLACIACVGAGYCFSEDLQPIIRCCIGICRSKDCAQANHAEHRQKKSDCVFHYSFPPILDLFLSKYNCMLTFKTLICVCK